jgi:hypothetical protein
MISFRAKYAIAAIIFVVGASMAVTPAFTKSNFELLIPGVILVAVSVPFVYYFRTRSKSTFRLKSQDEIIAEAKREAELQKGETNGKK